MSEIRRFEEPASLGRSVQRRRAAVFCLAFRWAISVCIDLIIALLHLHPVYPFQIAKIPCKCKHVRLVVEQFHFD